MIQSSRPPSPGAPDGYVEAEILEMSKQLASAAVKDVLQ